MPTMATGMGIRIMDTATRITDMTMATILPTATAITADILATTVAIGAMDGG